MEPALSSRKNCQLPKSVLWNRQRRTSTRLCIHLADESRRCCFRHTTSLEAVIPLRLIDAIAEPEAPLRLVRTAHKDWTLYPPSRLSHGGVPREQSHP